MGEAVQSKQWTREAVRVVVQSKSSTVQEGGGDVQSKQALRTSKRGGSAEGP
jgi:hypothetical protein